MKGTAISQIGQKVFAIFALSLGAENSVVIVEPEKISEILKTPISGVYVLPWQDDAFTVDFTNRESLQQTVDNLNKIITDIEPCDPWVKATFGIEGICEGVVYVPISPDGSPVSRKRYSDLAFKAKGEKHKVVKTKEAVQIDPEVAASVAEFVSLFVTEQRMEQGIAAIGGLDIKQVGAFLKWVSQDIIKESEDELEASNLEWEDMAKGVQAAARNWFLQKVKKI